MNATSKLAAVTATIRGPLPYHVVVDELPWWWADASDNNTVDIAGLPPGPAPTAASAARNLP